MQIHTNCRHYRGNIPCFPNKTRGKECPTCDEFDPIGKRILLVKLGAPGDVLRTTFLLPGIKRKWRDCELTWLTRENASALLANLPAVDRVLSVEKEGVIQLNGERFNLCLNLDNDPLASSIAGQIRADEVRGYRLDDQGRVVAANREAEPWLRLALLDRLKKENRRTYQDFMRQIVGLPSEPKDPIQIGLTQDERAGAESRLRNLGLGGSHPVAFNTGSGDRWKTKRWPTKSFGELAERIQAPSSERILLLGGPAEDEENSRLARQEPDRFVYPGVMPLRDFMAVVARCRLLVTADTLALHVGLGTGVRTLALFGPTSAPEIEGSDLLLKIEAPVDCTCCYLRACDKEPFCMDELKPEMAYDALVRHGWIDRETG